jgi:hypothetical protein
MSNMWTIFNVYQHPGIISLIFYIKLTAVVPNTYYYSYPSVS